MKAVTLAEALLAFHTEHCTPGSGTEPDRVDPTADVLIPSDSWDTFVELAKKEQADREVKNAFQQGLAGMPAVEVGRVAHAQATSVALAAKPYDLGVIACSASKTKLKKGQVIEARDLYTGDLFVASLAAAELLCRRVVILSAFHGVLELDAKIGEYDRKLPTAKREAQAWGERVCNRLRNIALDLGVHARSHVTIVMLAPQSYARWLPWRGDDNPVVIPPLKGLGIGQQKARLKLLAEGGVL